MNVSGASQFFAYPSAPQRVPGAIKPPAQHSGNDTFAVLFGGQPKGRDGHLGFRVAAEEQEKRVGSFILKVIVAGGVAVLGVCGYTLYDNGEPDNQPPPTPPASVAPENPQGNPPPASQPAAPANTGTKTEKAPKKETTTAAAPPPTGWDVWSQDGDTQWMVGGKPSRRGSNDPIFTNENATEYLVVVLSLEGKTCQAYPAHGSNVTLKKGGGGIVFKESGSDETSVIDVSDGDRVFFTNKNERPIRDKIAPDCFSILKDTDTWTELNLKPSK